MIKYTLDELDSLTRCPAAHAAGRAPDGPSNSEIIRDYIRMHLWGAPPEDISGFEDLHNMRTKTGTLRVTEGYAAAGDAAVRLRNSDIGRRLNGKTYAYSRTFGDVQVSHTPAGCRLSGPDGETLVVDIELLQNSQYESRHPWPVRRNALLKLLILEADPLVTEVRFVTASLEVPSRLATYSLGRPFVPPAGAPHVDMLSLWLTTLAHAPVETFLRLRCEECEYCRGTSDPDRVLKFEWAGGSLGAGVPDRDIIGMLGHWYLLASNLPKGE